MHAIAQSTAAQPNPPQWGDLLQLVPLRRRRLRSAWLLTNDFGGFVLAEPTALALLDQGKLPTTDPLWQQLDAQSFVVATLDRPALAAKMRDMLHYLRSGPNLHIFVVTLRCNHTCQYCHASRAPMTDTATDMSIETAERSVDFAFQTTSPTLLIEFQGGEPLANFEVVQHIIEYARQVNAFANKALMFSLVSNLTLLDDDKLAYLLDRKVQICTSLDGPAQVHDAVRQWKGGNSHATVVDWIGRINAAYVAAGLDPTQYRAEALPTITRLLLSDPVGLIDQYVAVGCHSIFLRHLDPFGWAATTRARLGYTMAEFLEFYRTAYLHIVDLNRRGTDFVERTAALMLAKIIGDTEPNFLDLRSPCGAGIGQIAYNHDGRLFTCDEGRMVDRAGDDCFCLGDVQTADYAATLTGPTVRAMVLASVLDGQPRCTNCTYKPWCGVCPVHNYCEQGSLHGRMGDSTWCAKHMGIFDFLFERMQVADAFERALLQRWATPRGQEHFLQETGGF